jgi:AcrR family transcriptional regulator
MTESGKKNRSTRKRESLIAAATKLFAKQGFESTTTREIAAEAGCAEGLIHLHFKGKGGLLSAIVLAHASRELFSYSGPLEATVEEEIVKSLERHFHHLWEERDLLQIVLSRAMIEPAIRAPLAEGGPILHAKTIADRLRQYKDCEHISDHELTMASHAITTLGFDYGFWRPTVMGLELEECREIARNAVRILARGLSFDGQRKPALELLK